MWLCARRGALCRAALPLRAPGRVAPRALRMRTGGNAGHIARAFHATPQLCADDGTSRPKKGENAGELSIEKIVPYNSHLVDSTLSEVSHAFLRRFPKSTVAHWEYEPYRHVLVFVDESMENVPVEERRKRMISIMQDALDHGELLRVESWDGFDFDIRGYTLDEVPADQVDWLKQKSVTLPESKQEAEMHPLQQSALKFQEELSTSEDLVQDYDETMRLFFEEHGPEDGMLTEEAFVEAERYGTVGEGEQFTAMREFKARELFARGTEGGDAMDLDGFLRCYDWRFKEANVQDEGERWMFAKMLLEALKQGRQLDKGA